MAQLLPLVKFKGLNNQEKQCPNIVPISVRIAEPEPQYNYCIQTTDYIVK